MKMVEWEIILECNYNCKYCGLLDKSIMPHNQYKKFIKKLNYLYSDIEIFVFGGEPYLHKYIDSIIQEFIQLKQPFVIQTNLSNYSANKIIDINKNYNINISIHPDQCDVNDIINNIIKVKNIVNIKNISLMYIGKKSLEYYNLISKVINVKLTPITDIACTGYAKILKEYLSLKNNKIYQNIYQFENDNIYINGISISRSKLWDMQNDGLFTPKNKECFYKDRYILFDPQLNEYNCCYRKNNDGYCLNDTCFFM